MALLSQTDIAADRVRDWRKVAYADVAARLAPPSAFPCTFSQNAFRRNLLRFSFVEAPGAAGVRAAAADLLSYVEACRAWDGRIDSAEPLLMVFSRDAAHFDTAAAYREFGWRVLQALHDSDPSPWPDDVSRDPEAPYWSFCYGGMQLFVNMSTPLHCRRRSRNLGRHFVLVINPRERFDLVAGNTPEGRKVRARIRARCASYDGLAHSPLLGSYQKGDLEWVQYFLPDVAGDTPAGSCPFTTRR